MKDAREKMTRTECGRASSLKDSFQNNDHDSRKNDMTPEKINASCKRIAPSLCYYSYILYIIYRDDRYDRYDSIFEHLPKIGKKRTTRNVFPSGPP